MAQEKQLISTIKKTIPAVVSIMISKHLEDIDKKLVGTIQEKAPSHMKANDTVEIGGGSGFLVSKDGVIVTNKHVLSDPDADYTVVLDDGRKFAAEILARDPLYDIAIVKIDGKNLPHLSLNSAADLQLGQTVMAIGNALGLFKNTVSHGIVSGLSRAITAKADPDAPPQEMRGLIQTDTPINLGSSGGPLVNASGEVVGINAATVSGAHSIGFAIPIDAVKRDLEDLKQHGRIRRPYLGLRYIIIDKELKAALGLPVDYGAIVTRESKDDAAVIKDGPAEKAGIQEDDILLQADEKNITTNHPLQEILDAKQAGEKVNFTVLRNGKEKKITVTLGERR